MALQGWDKNYREQLKIQEQEIEQTQAENAQLKLMISGGNPGGIPNRPWDDPSKEKGPFVPPPPREKLMIAHGEGRGPQPQYHDEYNRELPIPPWMQMDPSGKLIEIPWMKEQYMREHPELGLQISGIPEYDQFMQNMRRGSQNPKSGSINHHPPHIQKLILGIGKRIRA